MDRNGSSDVWHYISKCFFAKVEPMDWVVSFVHNTHRLANDFILDCFDVDITASR